MKQRLYHFLQIILLFVLLFNAGCKDDEGGSGSLPAFSGINIINITTSGATFVATINDDGGSTILEKGFCWSNTVNLPTIENNKIKVQSSGLGLSAEVTSLSTSTLYYVRAYAVNASGISYSSAVQFTTESGGVTLEKTVISEIGAESAYFSSSLINTDNKQIDERGFCYAITESPSINNSKIIVPGTTPNFSILASGLASNTMYYVRSYVISGTETVYGEINSFKTSPSENDELANYVAPDYADDYSSISSWEQRYLWNLANVHDPTVEKCGEYYYMYGTDASYGNVHVGHGHFPYRRSKDLVNWEFQGMAMNATPEWVKDTLNNMRGRLGLPQIDNPGYGYWAPVVRKAGSKYRMYYSIVIDNYIQTGKPSTTANFDGSWTERALIGLMETDDLASNQWEDKGMVVCSSSDKGTNWSRPSLNNWDGYFKWNAIDPSFIVTPEGEHWLVYGSWHSGIVSLKLNSQTGKLDKLGEPWDINALPDYGSRIYTRDINSRWQGSEAPEIIYNEQTGYYYLFLAYDELSVAYNTRVCRSRNINGPYVDFNGNDATNGIRDCKPILTHPYKFNNHSGWVGISHNCVFNDGSGNWYYVSQGRLPANTGGNAYSNAIMMGHVRKIRWTESGWPVVMPERYAAVPNVEISDSELVGAWENITLAYNYQKQQGSQTLTLSADKRATGAISGEWSWDAANKVLTIGTQKLLVEREVDWEASPRTHTIVFAGLTGDGNSLWGKKLK